MWVTPILWRSEFRNTLAGLIRQGTLSLETAVQISYRAEFWMGGREYTAMSDQVLQLAAGSSCSAYDCEFVAVAQSLELSLITADRQILRAFPSIAVSPEAFAA